MERKYYIIGGILTVLLIFAVILFFTMDSSPQPNNTGDIELVWWKTFEDTENIQQLIQDYQELHQNVRITYVKKDSVDYEDELIKAIAAGRAPDIFAIHNDWLPKHQEIIAPMPESIMSLRTYKDSFVDVAFDDFIKDNRIYAIPLTVDVLALYYNKDLLGSANVLPPTTWPELVNTVQKLTKVTRAGEFTTSGIALGTGNNVNRAVDIVSLIMLQNGTKFYSDDFRNATFDQTQQLNGSTKGFNPGNMALQFYTQFATPSKTSYSWNTRSDQSIDAFTQGKVAMMISYQYMQPLIKARAPNLNWDVTLVPQLSNEVAKVNFANYWGETVSKTSPNSQVAWDFLNFISSKAELTKYYAKHKIPSSRQDIIPSQLGDTELGPFAQSALTARSVYKKDAKVYEAVFLKMIDDVVLNNMDVEEVLHNAVQQINLSLQK